MLDGRGVAMVDLHGSPERQAKVPIQRYSSHRHQPCSPAKRTDGRPDYVFAMLSGRTAAKSATKSAKSAA
jgi:hypothetical protein